MSRCGIEPRAAIAMALMSIVVLSASRRAGAFRAFQLPRLLRWHSAGNSSRNRAAHTKNTTGPEGSTIPEIVHQTVHADELKAEVIIVGDVHGCHDEMVELLDKCGYKVGNVDDRKRFSVVLVGDLVNKGPKNAQVIKTARTEGFLAVRGNHDNFALSAANGVGRFSEEALSRGSKKPSAVLPWISELSREDREWLESLPYTLRFPSLGCIIVHAGLVPGVSLEEQDLGAMTRMRNVVDQGGGIFTSREHLSEGVPWAKTWAGPEHVYFGHDARRGFQKEAFATGLDTGCVYGRSLTAAILPGGKIVCVSAQAQWSPPGG